MNMLPAEPTPAFRPSAVLRAIALVLALGLVTSDLPRRIADNVQSPSKILDRLNWGLTNPEAVIRDTPILGVGAHNLPLAVQRLGSGEIPARGFGDMDPLAGDGLSMPVTWRGDPSLGHEGAPIILRFRLRQAKLFGVTFI